MNKTIEIKYKHPLAVRSEESNGFYSEYDEHDRVVYHKDKWGYFAFKYYHSESYILQPYHIIHKYMRLYNPELGFV